MYLATHKASRIRTVCKTAFAYSGTKKRKRKRKRKLKKILVKKRK